MTVSVIIISIWTRETSCSTRMIDWCSDHFSSLCLLICQYIIDYNFNCNYHMFCSDQYPLPSTVNPESPLPLVVITRDGQVCDKKLVIEKICISVYSLESSGTQLYQLGYCPLLVESHNSIVTDVYQSWLLGWNYAMFSPPKIFD